MWPAMASHGKPRPAMAGRGRPRPAIAGRGQPWPAMAGHSWPWPGNPSPAKCPCSEPRKRKGERLSLKHILGELEKSEKDNDNRLVALSTFIDDVPGISEAQANRLLGHALEYFEENQNFKNVTSRRVP